MSDFVSISTLATMLQNGLNGLLIAENFEFSIGAETIDLEQGKTIQRKEGKKTINGVIVAEPSTIIPLRGLNNYYMQLALFLPVPKDYINKVVTVLNSYIKANVGSLISVDGYAGVLNFDLPSVGNLEQMPIIGTGCVIYTNLYYQFIENGVLGNACVLAVDNVEMLTTEFSVVRNRVPQSDCVCNSESMKSVVSQQGCQISITIPYIKIQVYIDLLKEIYDMSLSKNHIVKYYDNTAFVAEAPIEKIMTLVTGSISYEVGKVPTMQLIFTEAYNA